MFYIWHKKSKLSSEHFSNIKAKDFCGTLDKVFHFSAGKVKVYLLDLSFPIFRRMRVGYSKPLVLLK